MCKEQKQKKQKELRRGPGVARGEAGDIPDVHMGAQEKKRRKEEEKNYTVWSGVCRCAKQVHAVLPGSSWNMANCFTAHEKQMLVTGEGLSRKVC